MRGSSFAQEVVIKLLADHEILSRRRIEATLNFECNISVANVTRALTYLRDKNSIKRTPIPHPAHPYDLYSLPDVGERAVFDYAARVVALGYRILSSNALRKAGEDFARSLVIASGSFDRVTQRKRLGGVALSQGFADMTATVKRTNSRTLIEVKNLNEVCHARAALFSKLFSNAARDNYFPLLIICHIEREANILCSELGIAVVELRRQILPNGLGPYFKSALLDAFGPEPREYVEGGRPLHRNVSERTRIDIERLGDPAFLGASLRRWDRTMQTISESDLEPLSQMDLRGIHRYIRDKAHFQT